MNNDIPASSFLNVGISLYKQDIRKSFTEVSKKNQNDNSIKNRGLCILMMLLDSITDESESESESESEETIIRQKNKYVKIIDNYIKK